MQILRLPSFGCSYTEASYYGWRHGLHLGPLLVLWGRLPPPPAPRCECCATEDRGLLRGMPRLMTAENEGRHICKDCLIVWYDEGLTSASEIGRRALEKRAKPDV